MGQKSIEFLEIDKMLKCSCQEIKRSSTFISIDRINTPKTQQITNTSNLPVGLLWDRDFMLEVRLHTKPLCLKFLLVGCTVNAHV